MDTITNIDEAKRFAFDTVYKALEAQRWERSMGKYRDQAAGREMLQCAYRGDYGRKCAAGHLMRDGMYQPHMESVAFDKLNPRMGDLLISPLGEFFNHSMNYNYIEMARLIRKMQQAHDTSETPDVMRKRFDNLKHELFGED